MTKNIFWQQTKISQELREQINNQKSCVIWFTGLSGSGKTTIANALEQELYKINKRTYLLDGDNIRHGLNKDLGFSDQDRSENIRRVAEVARLFVDAGVIVLVSFISPFKKDRAIARSLVKENEFIEVYVKCSLVTCENRDVKGLYKKVKNNEVKNFTGIDSGYDVPSEPELILDTEKLTIGQSVNKIIQYLKTGQLLFL